MRRRSKDQDPFGDLNLDDTFVQGAPVELSAEQREARRRRERLHREMEEGQRVAARSKRKARWRRRRRRAPIAIAVLVVGSFVLWRQTSGSPSGTALRSRPANVARPDRAAVQAVRTWPPPGREAARAPLGAPAPVAAPSNSFAFDDLQPNSMRPVAYDPCRPIHVVINARTAPAGADTLLDEALAAVSHATGLQLRVDGPTSEAPSDLRSPYQHDRYPDRWAPVLLAWSDPQETAGLAGLTVGLGGSDPVPVEGRDQKVYVTGAVTLDGPQMAETLTEPNGRAMARAIVEHELGHLVGLNHVDDRTQLMNPVGSRDVLAYAPGDLTGLAKLGQGDCFPSV